MNVDDTPQLGCDWPKSKTRSIYGIYYGIGAGFFHFQF